MARDRRYYIRLFIIGVLLIVAIALACMFVISIAKYALLVQIINTATNNLSHRSGLSIFLIRGIVIIVSIPFLMACVQFGRRVPFFWTGGESQPKLWFSTKASGIVIVFYIGLYSLALFWASQNAYSKKWCAVTPEGLRAFDSPGPEPIYGIETHKCTLDEIEAIRSQEGGRVGPGRIIIADARHYSFFSPTGKPLVWYYRSPNGEYEFFDQSGLYPGTGEPLRPIDNAARNEIISQQKAASKNGTPSPKGIVAPNNAKTTGTNVATKIPSPAPTYVAPLPTPQPRSEPPRTVPTVRLENFEVTITACHYSGDRVLCSGTIVNLGNQRRDVSMHTSASKIVDDQGNQNKGDTKFHIGSGAWSLTLDPDLPVRFEIEGAGFTNQPSYVSISLYDSYSAASGVIRRIAVQ
jgi:hypothetical protein